MKIFLIRHAEAIDYETDSVKEDEYRFITSVGRKVTGNVFKELKEEFNELEKIFTSPLIRAVQTAEILGAVINFKNEVELVNELRNESSSASLLELIKKNSNLKSVALIGHEPKTSVLVKMFSGKKDLTDFRKSSVCLIEFDSRHLNGKFIWYFDSKKMEYVK